VRRRSHGRRTSTRWVRIPPKLAKAIAKRNGDAAGGTTPKRAKYGNRKVTNEHGTFDSGREADRYLDLLALLRAGEIDSLERQPKFDLHGVAGKRIGRFTPDFRYRVVATGEVIVEDVKSKPTRTTAYMLRKKMFEAEHGKLTEVF
jgi:hypothetical protein